MTEHPYLDDEHVDAACAWLNIEHDVLVEVAQRDFDVDEVQLAAGTIGPTQRFLVDGFGEHGQEVFDEFSGTNLPDDLSDTELVANVKEKVAEASLPLAYYMLANKWAVQGLLQDAGATDDNLRSAWNETGARLIRLLGKETTERIARMYFEFDKLASGR